MYFILFEKTVGIAQTGAQTVKNRFENGILVTFDD